MSRGDEFLLALAACVLLTAAIAAVASLLIRNREQGLTIMAVFLVPALIGLLVKTDLFGHWDLAIGGSGVIGCLFAIGFVRYLPEWSGGRRAVASALGVIAVAALIVGVAAFEVYA